MSGAGAIRSIRTVIGSRACRRALLLLFVVAGAAALGSLLVLGVGAPVARAVVRVAKKPQATCKQLTKAEIQPLLSAPIATVKITRSGIAGQACVFSSADSEADIDIVVDKGSFAKQGYAAEVKGYSAKVPVQGVAGAHAYRDTGDSTIVALKGDEYSSVSGGPVPGVAAIEEGNGGSSNLPEHDHDVIATAFGTICNRIYGSCTTKPPLDGLSTPTPTTQ
jgi:hypothetical protein